MDPIILIVMCHVLFHPFFINGQEIQLSFNTSVYEGTNDYYAHIGENVTLTCTLPSTGARVYMSKGISWSFENLVLRSEPVGDLIYQMDKYSFQSNNRKYQITIHNLEKSDSLPYRCKFCTPCEFCMLPGLYRCHGPVVVQLDVKEKNDDSEIPDFCDLINNTDGIFFTGSYLILRCPKLSFSLEASNGSSEFSVDFEMEEHGEKFMLLTVKNVTTKFNGTMLSCLSSQNGEIDKNYCRSFPTILVFHNITIMLSGGEAGEHAISNGSNVTFTCHSHPFLPLTIQWDIMISNVTFENDSVSDIAQGSTITFINVEFLDSTSSSLTVFCNVTIGSENGFAMASIYPRMQVVSSTQTTSLLLSEISSTQITANGTMSVPGSGISSTKITASETMFVPGPDLPSFSPVSVVIPVIVMIVILGIITLGILYFKLRKRVSSNEVDRRNSNTYQDPVRVEQNVYNTMNLEKTELGLTYHDSEVADNVAYGSYDEDYKRG